MLAKLHNMGFRVALTVTPYMPMAGRNYVAAAKNGQLIMGDGNSPLVLHDRQGFPVGVLDMRRSDVFDSMKEALDKIHNTLKFDGYCFDMGLFGTGDKKFAENWTKLSERFPVLTLSGAAGSTHRPFAEDIRLSDQPSIDDIVINLTSAGMLGHPYVYTSYAPVPYTAQEAYRLVCLKVGLPMVVVDYAPWEIADQKLYASIKDILAFRAKIGEYVKELVLASGRTGDPLMRHMEYQFPKSGFSDCSDQFMLGSKYMFAPPTDAPKRLVRIPKGTWYDGHGRRHKGPRVIEIDCGDALAGCFTQ